ncbi:MAG: hypothetical protein H7A09_06760 [Oceanospirillaceae bacterium]|nr:hypothetical protein [Oceanospirillaceae bacterium]MCP5335793.1 hypothetical protein [Oceanospirillaceae bacterium]MCP5349903.1 hypothetical protein [Oceanospirillaceae bacterium]
MGGIKLPLMAPAFLCLCLAGLLTACQKTEESPAQIYLRYHQAEIEGLDFARETLFFSAHKQAEVEKSLQAMMQQMQKDRESVIALTQAFSKSVAKCREITLQSEEINGRFAIVVFAQKDICGSELTGDEKQIIHFVKENGWKIDDIEIQI